MILFHECAELLPTDGAVGIEPIDRGEAAVTVLEPGIVVVVYGQRGIGIKETERRPELRRADILEKCPHVVGNGPALFLRPAHYFLQILFAYVHRAKPAVFTEPCRQDRDRHLGCRRPCRAAEGDHIEQVALEKGRVTDPVTLDQSVLLIIRAPGRAHAQHEQKRIGHGHRTNAEQQVHGQYQCPHRRRPASNLWQERHATTFPPQPRCCGTAVYPKCATATR